MSLESPPLISGRARASGAKAIFWLDPLRAHDSHLMRIAKAALKSQVGRLKDIMLDTKLTKSLLSLVIPIIRPMIY